MAKMLKEYSYYKMTRGMCSSCRDIVDARIFEKEGKIFQENICTACGNTATLVADDSRWYFDHVNFPIKLQPPRGPQTKPARGCPYDCGLCTWHENGPNLPVFSITNACNLRCPICFTYNRQDRQYFMSREEMRKTLDFLLANKPQYDLINITGGEPTLHPDLISLLRMAKNERIGRITLNSNGIRLAWDEDLVRQLSELGVYVILSFDTLDPEISMKIHGMDLVDLKLKALEVLTRHNIGVTLLNVMIKGVNDHEIFDIISLSSRYASIRSITVQTMTFTGQGGTTFSPHDRLTLDMAAKIIQDRSDGMIDTSNFFPLPSNHPLCYSIAYFFKRPHRLQSFTDILPKEELISLIGNNYIMHPDDRFHDAFKEAVTRKWVDDTNHDLLQFLKHLLKRMYPAGHDIQPFERQKIAEESILTIYIHAHMDEENFDLSRIVCCTDLVPVDGERFIPACAYNLFYRMNDERFWKDKGDE